MGKSSKHRAKALMFLGAGSDVGKSVLAAAFCRILKQDGFRVAPFKAQNMALNSFITPAGGEMGRAQVVQAEAAGLEPHVDMNPILLKPTSLMGSQVIVRGKAIGNYSARDYYRYKPQLVSVVQESYDRLSRDFEVIVLEGAGSAVELNLKEHDLVNMSMARRADARCILIGDIDRGGIFASLLGSLLLMEPEEQNRIIGFMVNKLRGDPTLFDRGVEILEARGARPVLGVIPHFEHIAIPEEDSVALSKRLSAADKEVKGHSLSIGVVRFPFVSNYTDFDCFEQDPEVALSYFLHPAQTFQFDAVILPGSKNTLEDLDFLKRSGLAEAIAAFHKAGGTVVGICGGYQMLGQWIRDPHGVESSLKELPGLGLLPIETEMSTDKITTQVEAVARPMGLPAGADTEAAVSSASTGPDGAGEKLFGYEIHMGRSRPLAPSVRPCFQIVKRNGLRVDGPDRDDGLITEDGRAWGTYIHGVFDNDGFRRRFLEWLHDRSGKAGPRPSGSFSYLNWRESQYDQLAEHVRRHADVDKIYDLIGLA